MKINMSVIDDLKCKLTNAIKQNISNAYLCRVLYFAIPCSLRLIIARKSKQETQWWSHDYQIGCAM
jgi:hypothetical protein